MPLYPLYALLFADSGLSAAEISGLFALWSLVAVAAEVPAGAWADRHSRRVACALAGVLQAVGYALWIALPELAGFAAGFALWGLGGALSSGAFQALVHDGLAAAGAEDRYAATMGRAEAAGLAVQVPVALAAGLLVGTGGYALAGAVSIAACLSAAALAATLPDVRAAALPASPMGWAATLRAGVAEAAASRAARGAALALVALTGLDGLEEYFPLLAAGWGVPTQAVPPALLVVALAGAAGAALAARGERLGRPALALVTVGAAAALAVAGGLARPAGLLGLALFYGLWQLLLVVADARLQAAIAGPARATVTSVAATGGELASLVLFAAWALGGLPLAAALALLVALVPPPRALPR